MNKEVTINLSSINKVKQFVHITEEFQSDIDVILGKYTVDGKSIMGLFSLNLLEPLFVRIDSEDENEIESFNRVMEEFKYEHNEC